MAQRGSLAGAARRAVSGAKKAVQAVNPSSPRAQKAAAKKQGAQAKAAPGAKRAAKAPAKTTAKAPAKTTAKAPVKAGAKAPAKTTAKTGAKAPAKTTKTAKTTGTAKTAKTAKTARKPAAARATAKPAAKVTSVTPASGGPGRSIAARSDEDPWTDAEVREIRDQLTAERERLAAEVAGLQSAITDVMRDTSDGGGEDQADTGGKALEREQELTLLRNVRETLEQTERALTRLAEGTYGNCESCGSAIGKLRLQAFPRATLCVACKQRQERR